MTPTTETTLRFTGEWPFWPVVLAALVLAAVMAWLYQRGMRYQSSPLAKVPVICRSLAVFLLVLALAGPVVRHMTTTRQLGRVVVAVDGSASMKLEDSVTAPSSDGTAAPKTAQLTRYQRAERLLFSGPNPLLKKLSETQDVDLVLLRGSQVQRLWWKRQDGKDTSGELPTGFELQPDTPVTNLDSSLRDALGPAAPGTALVLLTDGQHNAAGSPEEFATAMKQAATPIFPIGFGAEVPPADISILNVITAESAFTEENLQGRVVINDSLPSGTPALIRIESQSRTVWEQAFTADGKGERRFDFSFPVRTLPEAPANETDKTLRMLRVQVALQGNHTNIEKTKSNNFREVALHLLTKKRKLLMIDGRARWETRYIHNHFDRDERWQVSLLIDDYADKPESGSIQKEFPKTKDELLSYDLLLLGDVSPSRFRPEQIDWLIEFVEKRGGGLILLDGARGHLREWATGKTAGLLPVKFGNAMVIKRGDSLQWRLTPDGERTDGLRLSDSPSANSSLWPTLPTMRWASSASALPAALTLATLSLASPAAPSATPKEGHTALVFRSVGAGAVLYVGTDELWRWRFQVGDLYHQRLWTQLAAWIAAPPFQVEENRLSIGTDRLRYSPGEQSEIRVRVRNDSGALVTNAQPRAYVMHEGKEIAALQLDPDPTHTGVYRALTPPLKTGAYEIAVADGPTSPRSTHRLSLRVADAGNPEWATLTMNRPLLETMANASGGRFMREEAAAELPSLLRSLDQKQTQTRETLLWSSWWWMGAVILLLCVEWITRRLLRLV